MSTNINQLITYPFQTGENQKRAGIFLLYSFIINLLIATPIFFIYSLAFLSPGNYDNLFESNAFSTMSLSIVLGYLLVTGLYLMWSIFKSGLEIKQIQNLMRNQYEVVQINIKDSSIWKKGLIAFIIRTALVFLVIILLTLGLVAALLSTTKSHHSPVILIVSIIITTIILIIPLLILLMGIMPSVYYFLASDEYRISDIFSMKFLEHVKEYFWKNVVASLVVYGISQSIKVVLTVFLLLIPFSQIISNPISDIISFIAKTSTYSSLYKLYYKNK